MHHRCAFFAAAAFVCISPIAFGQSAPAVLARYPNTHGDTVVFVARDKLWTVPISGGTATNLEGAPAEPIAPRYSPDGQWIAFTALRDGNRDVYIVPARGGETRRLTWSADNSAAPRTYFGPNNLVVGWTPDSRNVLFLSRKTSFVVDQPQLYSVPATGGLPVRTALLDAASISYSGDARRAAITRTFSAYRPWKRYDGGLAPEISTIDLESGAVSQLTHWKGTDDFPMWQGDKIFFLSDRDSSRRRNLWVMDEDGGHARELTHFVDQDIDFPSLGDGRITFQQGGRLWLYDTATQALKEVAVSVPDDGAATKPQTVDTTPLIRANDVTRLRDYAIAPDGSSVLFSAMGDIVEATGSATKNLTHSDTVDEDHPSYSPDGRTIAYSSDRSGEQQIVVRNLDGGAEHPLTRTDSGYYYTPVWSDDGRSLVVAAADHSLWLLHADGSTPLRVTLDPAAEVRDAVFSTDGKAIFYSTQGANLQRVLHVFDIAARADTIVSSPMNSDWSPRVSPDGRELFFLSNRHAQPIASDREDDMVPANSFGVYRVPLKDGRPMMRDALPVALPGGTYDLIGVRGGGLFVMEQAMATLGGEVEGTTSRLHRLDTRTGEDVVVAKGVDSVDVSRDGRHLVMYADKTYRRLDLDTGTQSPLNVEGMHTEVVWQHAWKEMFESAYRLQRDLYYSRTMDGSDIKRTRAMLERLLPLLGSASDFNYIVSELQGELGSSHMWYNAAPSNKPAAREALLGIDLVQDARTRRYRIARIIPGDNSRPELRSPLEAPGLDVAEGDYILAINGHALSPTENPDRFLSDVNGKVRLTIASAPEGKAHDVEVDPLSSERDLREFDFVERSRKEVDRLSGGRVGYIYMTDMAGKGTQQFIRQYYPQQNKEGLVLDVRWNGGGWTAQLILERLRRTVAGVFLNRQDACVALPDGTVAGPKVVVTNQYSSSDGDQFPYFFREYGLGKVVGMRTWGGVRGVLGSWSLMDGTRISIPKDVLLTTAGEPIIENVGTKPDIEVDADATGTRDAPLETAVRQLLPSLRKNACAKAVGARSARGVVL